MSIDCLPDGAEPMAPPTPVKRHEINELMRVVRSYTYPVIFDARNRYLGTVVLLRKGERLFGFTAAHNVTGDMMIHLRLGPEHDKAVFKIRSEYVHPNYAPDPVTGVSKFDLAILELDPNAAVAAGSVEQLYTGGILKMKEGERDQRAMDNSFVWVVGFPAELVVQSKSRTILRQSAFCTQMLDYTPDELTILYPESGYQIPHDAWSCEEGRMPPSPKGYSGGGVWFTGNPAGKLFDPHQHIKLVGIQTHWSSKSRLARCVPSRVVFEALKDFKPDLFGG